MGGWPGVDLAGRQTLALQTARLERGSNLFTLAHYTLLNTPPPCKGGSLGLAS